MALTVATSKPRPGSSASQGANQRFLTPAKRSRLSKDQVKYLVFEGGGGKGFAYLGALQALEDMGVLQYIEPQPDILPTADGMRHSLLHAGRIHGVGGASAGAITAFLLSIGYTPDELQALMLDTSKFLAFFDGGFNEKDTKGNQVRTRMRPVYGGCEVVDDDPEEEKAKVRLRFAAKLLPALELLAVNTCPPLMLLYNLTRDTSTSIKKFLQDNKDKPPFDTLTKHWTDFAVNFEKDWGLFAGCAARELFDKLLSDRLPLGNGKPQRNVTFQIHHDYFGIELLVTGTDLLTGKSQVFSLQDTPDFPVADAVRISMGIPFVFKPLVIKDGPQSGVWVDGGLLNNIPFREFDDRPGENPKTLALRLDLETLQRPITTAKEFLTKYLNLALFGPGEAFVTSSHAYQTIELDTKGLSLLDFAPDPKVSKRVQLDAASKTRSYFTGKRNERSIIFE